jgi:hypothetical protein
METGIIWTNSTLKYLSGNEKIKWKNSNSNNNCAGK